MFKLLKNIFKLMSLFTGLLLILSALILWRGGEDFRWAGKKTEEFGRSIADFGDAADKALELRKKFTGTPDRVSDYKKSIQKQGRKDKQEPTSFQQEIKK